MNTKVLTKYIEGMRFESYSDGHMIPLDISVENGGQDTGARPKPLLLTALSGCSGMDVVSILKKMKIENYELDIELEAEPTDDHPIYYHTITMAFKFKGENLNAERIMRAVNLSNEKYCGASEMLKKAANIIVKVYINEEEVVQ
ncbi:MAG: OsmC family protein [Candidatus Cloacimonetes bacterium]|jgi:putative redox protein|nr:OsmC family protein [Candidatus Cloacimonadota bacterium]NLO44754.1 OsmC family protein [Candidatus Cloacimonadota bacterium]